MRILLDTNIVVDFLTKRQPWYQDTVRLFDLMARGAFEGYVSAHAITTVDYLARKKIKESAAGRRSLLLSLLTHVQVGTVARATIDMALGSPIQDFEDAVAWAVASDLGCDFILTRDQRDFGDSSPGTISPLTLLTHLRSFG